jgi:hypothetical protein
LSHYWQSFLRMLLGKVVMEGLLAGLEAVMEVVTEPLLEPEEGKTWHRGAVATFLTERKSAAIEDTFKMLAVAGQLTINCLTLTIA